MTNAPEPPIAALCVTFPVAFKINCAADELPMVIAALMAIVLSAVKVSELPLAQEIGLEIVMVPALPPLVPVLVVVTVMLLLPSALPNVVVFTVAVAAAELGVNTLDKLV